MQRHPQATNAVLFALVLPALLAAQGSPQVSRAALATRLDSIAQSYLSEARAPGYAVAVVRGPDTLLMRAYGSANLELRVAATPTSVFRIGSITKQFTAAAVMQLVDHDSLALSDTVGRYIADLPRAWQGTTIEQLLNHTSGIPSYTDAGTSWMKRWGEEMSGRDLIALTADKPLTFARGAGWKYNNTGYVLLGMVLEARTGRPWHEVLASRFFTPLGMTRTSYCLTQPLIADRASGYSRTPAGDWTNASYVAMSHPHAAGALCSTVGDLVTWNRALHGGKIVSAASYTLMTTARGAATRTRGGYGFGLVPDNFRGRPAISHGGGINGFTSQGYWVPEQQLIVVVLTNNDTSTPDELSRRLTRAVLGIPEDPAPVRVTLAPAERARFVGTYTLTIGGAQPRFTVLEMGAGLGGQLEGQGASPIHYLGNGTFGVDFDPAVRLTFEPATGVATGFTLLQGGQTFHAVRRP
jgi:D-alanyl-D-alanine carboxypeptidase